MKALITLTLAASFFAAAAARAQTTPAPMTHDMHNMSMGVDLPATDGPGFIKVDVQFMQGMIPHHAQAIVMAKMAASHGAGPRLLLLTRKIDISQSDEIKMMKRWLTDAKQVVPTDAQVAMMFMPGMLTPEQMARLDAARGVEFERLFLTFMIQHHQGAIAMTNDLFAIPGAAHDAMLYGFATDVYADQSAEIEVMTEMLEALPGE
jgi:uncharacterized protein (DUF305 family)